MIKKLLLLVVLLSCCGQVQAKCEKSDIISGKLFTDICWDCVLPIVVAHVNLGASSKSWKPSGATDKYLCVCKNSGGIPTVGVATSFWEPARLIEFEFQPGCLSVLNANLGKSVDGGNPNFDRIQQGTRNTNLQGANKGTTFMHYHYYAFPILQILDMFTGFGCSSDGFLDLAGEGHALERRVFALAVELQWFTSLFRLFFGVPDHGATCTHLQDSSTARQI